MTTLAWVVVGLVLGAAGVALLDRGRRQRAAQLEADAQETAARIVEESRKEGEVDPQGGTAPGEGRGAAGQDRLRSARRATSAGRS